MVSEFSERRSFSSSFFTQELCQFVFSISNLPFQSVLICLVLNAENITKMPHMQQWFY